MQAPAVASTVNYKLKSDQIDLLIDASKEIEDVWINGDFNGLIKSGKIKCNDLLPDKHLYLPSFLKCNPRFLHCYYRSKEFQTPKGVTVHFDESKLYDFVFTRDYLESNTNNIGLKVKISVGEFTQDLILKNTCAETSLPKGQYRYGEFNELVDDIAWENDSNILVDRNLVTNYDILNWTKVDKTPKKITFSSERNELHLPAVKLNLQEMKGYCAFRKKQMLQAHVFDAATFYPEVVTKNRVKVGKLRGPLPWTRKHEYDFLNKDHCKIIFTQECIKSAYKEQAFSWIGLTQTLGGPMEAMDNPFHPRRNVLASSYYFPLESPWHGLGQRIFWDGINRNYYSFNFKKNVPEFNQFRDANFDIGFRCMRKL